MKKYLPHIFIVALILGWTGVFGVEVVQAQAPNAASYVLSPFKSISQDLANLVLQAMSFFVYVSGLLLDYSLAWTLNIANLVDNIPAIETGWKVFRDLCTMFFIFILLYTAITTILGIGGGKENAKKVITSVVIAGLLINFSLFFTKIIIDASNLVSLSFYKALVPEPDKLSIKQAIGVGNGTNRTGLSSIFMDSLYIQTVYDPSGLKTVKNDQLTGSAVTSGAEPFFRIMINMVMGSIVMLVASIVFLAGAFFFTVRIVILLLLMVTSPIAFAGEALGGKAASQSKRWKETLIDQCLFMPVYLAVTYVGIKIVSSPGFQNAVNPGNSSLSAMTGGGAIGVIFSYLVVIIFLMASLIIAKEFGVMGAATFNGWAESVLKAVPNMAGGAGSWAARRSLGQVGADLDKKLGNSVIGNSRMGRSLREVTTGALANSKFGGSMSMVEQKKLDKEIEAKKRQINDNSTIRTADEIKAAVAKRGTPASAAEQAQIDAGEIALNKMSASDITEQSPKMLEENAQRLNDNHIKAIIKSDKITDADKEKILSARFAPIDKELAIINNSGKSATEKDAAKTRLEAAIKNLSDTDIENLGYERLKDKNLIAAMPYSKIKTATDKKTENYSVAQKAEFKNAKLAPLTEALNTGNSLGAQKALAELKFTPEELVTELKPEMLAMPAIIPFLRPETLGKMIEKGTDPSIRYQIKTQIENLVTSVPPNRLTAETKLAHEWFNGRAAVRAAGGRPAVKAKPPNPASALF